MPFPAFERIPVEIWLRILRFALASPLSPGLGNNILDYRDVFLTVCDSDQAALAHENNVASFRLVCKSWDAAVKKFQQKMILCDFGKRRRFGVPNPFPGGWFKPEYVPLHLFQKPTLDKLPQVTRVEAWTLEGYCYCFRPTCRYKKFSMSREHPARNLPEAPHSGTSVSAIDSLLIGMKVDDDYLRSLLDATPSLRALSCRIRDKPMWKTIFQRATCQRLTHLQVRVSWAPFVRSLSHISLSELVYLGVIFHLPPNSADIANPPLDNVEWCPQPKLKYLELEGTVLERRRDEFYAFLAVDRPNLSGLILRVHTKWKYLIPSNISVTFPNLTSFGVEMAALLVRPLPPPPSMTPIDIVPIFGVTDAWHHADILLVDFLEAIREMCRQWKPKRIVLPTTWEAEGQFVKGFELSVCKESPRLSYLPHYFQFFQVLKEEDITVVDRDGQSTEAIAGRRYIESLKMHGFDRYDSGLKLEEAWGDARPKVPFKPGTKGCTSSRIIAGNSD